jgi:hypothetical protein
MIILKQLLGFMCIMPIGTAFVSSAVAAYGDPFWWRVIKSVIGAIFMVVGFMLLRGKW